MNKHTIRTLFCALLLALLPGCDVISALEIAPDTQSLPGDTAIAFKDPVVEKLVRAELNKPAGIVTAEDMKMITSFRFGPHDPGVAGMDPIRALDDLRYCDNLEDLKIFEQPVESIECLRKLKHLHHLEIWDGNITDLSPLEGKESLTYVWIKGNPVTDASPVLSLPSLTTFNGSGTGIADISALSRTHGLREFYCGKLADYTPLLSHKNLRAVELVGANDVFLAQLLKSCKFLTCVNLYDSSINNEDLSLLAGLNLEELSLFNCGIKDLSALPPLPALKSLRLADNMIQDISPLAGYMQLSELNLKNNRIRDWSPLEKMRFLKNLAVSGNPVTDSDVLTMLEQSGCTVYR